MATLTIRKSADLEFLRARDVSPEELRHKLSDAELDSDVRTFFPGSETEPQLFERKLAPGVVVDPHAHEVDQIMVVLEGELQFGAQICPVGTAVHIKGHSLYGFRAGPAGARFFNFRPRADRTHILKDEFLSSRAAND
ncbi:MAG: cupin domain-containing protein [Ilumatobacteraceae bacterium]